MKFMFDMNMITGGYEMLHLELYRIFYYVATYKNITHAASLLYISQPAVSKSIKKLEALTNCTLFIRGQKGVSLTSEGEILFEYIQKAFYYLDGGENIIKKINNLEDGSVRIGISNTLCRYCLFPQLEIFHSKYPHISIKIMNQPTPDTCALLEEGTIDFGIISIPNYEIGYNYIKLMTVNDVFVSKEPYEQDSLPLEGLLDLPIMLMEKENQTRIYIDDFLRKRGIILKPEIEIGSMEFLIELAKIGIGTACVIKEFVLKELESGILYEIPITPKPSPREIGIITKEQIPISKASKRFIEYLKEKFNNGFLPNGRLF